MKYRISKNHELQNIYILKSIKSVLSQQLTNALHHGVFPKHKKNPTLVFHQSEVPVNS